MSVPGLTRLDIGLPVTNDCALLHLRVLYLSFLEVVFQMLNVYIISIIGSTFANVNTRFTVAKIQSKHYPNAYTTLPEAYHFGVFGHISLYRKIPCPSLGGWGLREFVLAVAFSEIIP